MNTIRKAALTVAGLGVGAAGLVGVSTAANADTPSTTPSVSASAAPGKAADKTSDADHAAHEDAFASELAEKLGVDKDKVAQALEEIRAAHPRPEGHGPRGDQDGSRGPQPGQNAGTQPGGQNAGQQPGGQSAGQQPGGQQGGSGNTAGGAPSAAPSSASTPR